VGRRCACDEGRNRMITQTRHKLAFYTCASTVATQKRRESFFGFRVFFHEAASIVRDMFTATPKNASRGVPRLGALLILEEDFVILLFVLPPSTTPHNRHSSMAMHLLLGSRRLFGTAARSGVCCNCRVLHVVSDGRGGFWCQQPCRSSKHIASNNNNNNNLVLSELLLQYNDTPRCHA
jgi:hypothetical protein